MAKLFLYYFQLSLEHLLVHFIWFLFDKLLQFLSIDFVAELQPHVKGALGAIIDVIGVDILYLRLASFEIGAQ